VTYPWNRRSFCPWHRKHLRFIPRLHDQAGSTSWPYVSWTSQLDVCSTFVRRLLDVCSLLARLCKRGITCIRSL